jgi:hypothetical protein
MMRTRALCTLTAVATTIVATVALGIPASSVDAANIDPLLDQQWGLLAIGAPQVWNQSTGVGVTVAIIDGGSGPHPDLDSNMDPGLSIIDGVETSGANDLAPENGHGTHVAGIVAAVNGNGIGVSGVAPNARILPIRVFPAVGQSNTNDVARAITFAVDSGVKVINLSLGGDAESPQISDAVKYAVDHNVLVVAAAGNKLGENELPKWPAVDDNTLAVTAIDESNNVASFGLRGDYIDLSAPGVDILSTKTSNYTCVSGVQPDGYGCLQGTSMAAPFVSGAAALLFAARPNITAAQVRFLLISTAIDLGTAGRDTTYGAGLINLPAAFAALNILFPIVNDPIITTNGRVGSVATGVLPSMTQSPKLQWFRCGSQGAVTIAPTSDCKQITNAVALTYQMTAKDLRLFLRFSVTTTTAGVTTKALSATSPKIIAIWPKVDVLKRGTTYSLGQLIGSPSQGVRSIKVLAGSCVIKNSTLVVRKNATECKFKATIAAKSPFPQLTFTATISSNP